MASSAANQIADYTEFISKTTEELDLCSCGLAVDGAGDAYDEETFRYFLTIERKRSEASKRPFLLLLVELDKQAGLPGLIESAAAKQLFAGLWCCLRETDLIGWYRETRVAGAVLTHLGETALTDDVLRQVEQRVGRVLRDVLPARLGRRLQVRLYHFRSDIAGDGVAGSDTV